MAAEVRVAFDEHRVGRSRRFERFAVNRWLGSTSGSRRDVTIRAVRSHTVTGAEPLGQSLPERVMLEQPRSEKSGNRGRCRTAGIESLRARVWASQRERGVGIVDRVGAG